MRVMKFFFRITILALGALFLFKVIPSFADAIEGINQTQTVEISENSNSESNNFENTPNPSVTEGASEGSITNVDSSDSSKLNEDDAISENLEEEDSKKEAVALENQQMFTRIPTDVPVDPRSRNYVFTSAVLNGPANILLCIEGMPSLVSRVSSINENELLISGNGTRNLRISGSSWDIQNVISNDRGIQFTSMASLLTNETAIFRFIALDKPSISSKLCESASPENIKILNFRALGINLEIKKGVVILKR